MVADHEEVKLLGKWASPFSNRIDLALKLKGVQYKYSEEDLSNKSSDLLKYHPVHKKVSVLVYNGSPIAESLLILEYVLARFWCGTLDDKVNSDEFIFVMGSVLACYACWSDEKGREKAVEEAMETLRIILQNELKDKRFFGGETIGVLGWNITRDCRAGVVDL